MEILKSIIIWAALISWAAVAGTLILAVIAIGRR